MKKKLLLSSVAALTLFAAYNTASAEYGTYGERERSVEKLPNAFTIEKAQTVQELEDATYKYEIRQEYVLALRLANHELNAAKDAEANAKTRFEKAQKAFDEATQKVADAVNTRYDANEQREKLKDVLVSIENRLAYDTTQLTNAEALLQPALNKQSDASTALSNAEQTLNAFKLTNPGPQAPVDVLKEFKLEQLRLERNVETAKDAKTLADKAVEKLKKEIADLKLAKETAKDKITSLKDAIDRLGEVVGVNEESKIRGVLLTELEKELEAARVELAAASENRITSTSNRKEAQKDYDKALEEAKAVFKDQNIDFVLEEVLLVAKQTNTYFKTFGWAKDEAGNWNYLLDSDGKKATGWVNDAGSWYYLGQDGVMKKWWVQVDGTWYYLDGSGVMQTGWLNDNGTWYYLEASGAMKANQWFEVGGKWYHVEASGALSVNTTVDGYNVNENGEWV